MSDVTGIKVKVTVLHPSDDGKCDVIGKSESGNYYLFTSVSPPFPEIDGDVVIPYDWEKDASLSSRIAKIEFID